MKKLKKQDFKKLALLGLASGTAMAAQAVATEQTNNIIDSSQTLAFNGCGGGRCGGHYQAYRNTPQNNYYYDNSGAGTNGCNGAAPSQGTVQPAQPTSGCHNTSASQGQSPTAYNQRSSYYYNQQQTQPQTSCASAPQTSCNGMSQPKGSVQPTTPSSSCGGASTSQGQSPTAYNQRGSSYYYQPQSGCGGQTSNNQNPSYPQMWQSTQAAQPQTSCAAPSKPQPVTPPSNNGAGVAPSQTQGSSTYNQRYNQWETADNGKAAATTAPAITESDLMSQLNIQGKSSYQALDASGKAMALKMASQSCKGQNECKGMNACKTPTNACAGKGSCANTAKGPFTDKNLAVKVAAMKMAEKRTKASSSKY